MVATRNTPTSAAVDAANPGLLTPLRIVAGLMALAVLFQAVAAGQYEGLPYGDWTITPHAIAAGISLVLGVAGAALAYGVGGDARRTLLPVAGGLAVLLVLQYGMGQAIRESSGLGAIHIPVGVAIFGLVIYQVALVRRVASGRS